MHILWLLVGLLQGRPFVLLKIAVDRSGAVDDLSSGPKRFTCGEALDEVHRIRGEMDAVLVGVGTAVRDDPSLTVRRVALPSGRLQPLRVVLDPRTSKLMTDGHRSLFFKRSDIAWDGGEDEAVEVAGLPPQESGRLSAEDVLRELNDRGVRKVLVEGGPHTALNFLQEKLVDEMILVRASVTFKEPVPSLLTDEVIAEAELRETQRTKWGVDEVTFFTKDS